MLMERNELLGGLPAIPGVLPDLLSALVWNAIWKERWGKKRESRAGFCEGVRVKNELNDQKEYNWGEFGSTGFSG